MRRGLHKIFNIALRELNIATFAMKYDFLSLLTFTFRIGTFLITIRGNANGLTNNVKLLGNSLSKFQVKKIDYFSFIYFLLLQR